MATIQPLLTSSNTNNTGYYPLEDRATLTSTTGQFIAPQAFLDARLYPPSGINSQFISRIVVTQNEVLLEVADTARGTFCSGKAVAADETDSGTPVVLRTTNDIVVGLILIDRSYLLGSAKIPFSLSFSQNALPIAASCVVPQPQPVAEAVVDADGLLLAGDVWLVGENGVTLRVAGQEITAHIVGNRYYTKEACGREAADYTPRNFLTGVCIMKDGVAIETITPDSAGNILILPGEYVSADTAFRVHSQAPNSLTIGAIGNLT